MSEPRTTRDDERLPIDPDIEQESPRAPVHLRPSSIGLVLVGGALGTAGREGLSLAFPPVHGVPYVILVINVVGAFVLGLLLDALARRGADEGRRRTLRLLLGSGALGGFTTYSALATDSAHLIGDGSTGPGFAYAAVTLVVGAVATTCGIAAASAQHGRTSRGGVE